MHPRNSAWIALPDNKNAWATSQPPMEGTVADLHGCTVRVGQPGKDIVQELGIKIG